MREVRSLSCMNITYLTSLENLGNINPLGITRNVMRISWKIASLWSGHTGPFFVFYIYQTVFSIYLLWKLGLLRYKNQAIPYITPLLWRLVFSRWMPTRIQLIYPWCRPRHGSPAQFHGSHSWPGQCRTTGPDVRSRTRSCEYIMIRIRLNNIRFFHNILTSLNHDIWIFIKNVYIPDRQLERQDDAPIPALIRPLNDIVLQLLHLYDFWMIW